MYYTFTQKIVKQPLFSRILFLEYEKQAHDIQSWTFAYVWLLNKPYVNWVTLREQNQSLKCCQPLELLIYFGKGFRSFATGNIGSVGQRAAKVDSCQS